MNRYNTPYRKILYVSLFMLVAFFGGMFGAIIYEYQLKTPVSNDSSSLINSTANTCSSNSMDTADTVEQVADCVVDVLAENSVGSGVIYSKDGYIITNEHVIRKSNKIVVKLKDKKNYTATLVGIDSNNDIAVIKINEKNLNPVKFADFSKVRLGETTIVIGNPLGELSGSVSDGVVSAKERLVNVDGKQMKLMQTCAEINSGNSGGGVFRLNGELVGIVVAKSSGENLEGLGFAIPSNDVKESVEKILKKV